MKRKDDLFQLVKSLSKSEKRFFKIYSGRHVIGEQNNYVELFDAIGKQSHYDENALLRKFEDKKFVRRFSVAKAYLYDLILKSMNTYHAQGSIDAQVLELMRNVGFLVEKNLYEQAGKLLSKARKLALEYEKLAILPEIIAWEKKLMEASFYENRELSDITDTYEQSRKSLQKAIDVNEYWVLNAQLYYQYNVRGIVRNRKDLEKVESVFNSPLLKGEDQAASYESQLLLYKIHSTYFFILRDFESCYKYVQKLVDVQEQRPEMIRYEPMLYVQSLNNLLNMTAALDKKEASQEHLAKLKAMMQENQYARNKALQLKLFESYYYHLLNYYRDRKEFELGLSQVAAIEKGFEDFGDKVDLMGQLMLRFHIFHICYGATDFEGAKKWLLEILTISGSNLRQDIYFFSRVLLLMMQFELKEQEHYSFTVKQLYADLINRKQAYKIEELLFQFLRNLKNIASDNDVRAALNNLLNELKTLSQDPFEKKAFAYFDFISWIEKQLANKKRLLLSKNSSQNQLS